MNVRLAPEVPKHRRSFNLPYVPNSIISDILIFVEGHVKIIESAVLDELHGFVRIGFPEGREHIGHHFPDFILLIVG